MNYPSSSVSEAEREQDFFSMEVLGALSKSGDLETLQIFLEETLPSFPLPRQSSYCNHIMAHPDDRCEDLPCAFLVSYLLESAARGSQVDIFAYLWDSYYVPRGKTSIPWRCLRTAAIQGSLPLAEAFYSRDRHCFETPKPPVVHEPELTNVTQLKLAIRNDQFEYVDFLLAHGTDINTCVHLPGNDLFRTLVRCEADDATTLRRIRFLTSRGATAAGSSALRQVVAADNVELAACLLDGGVDVDDVSGSCEASVLMMAASLGFPKMVKLLLKRGADIELLDPEGHSAVDVAQIRGHDSIVEILRAHHTKTKEQL